MRCVFLAVFALSAYTLAMTYEPGGGRVPQTGYSNADLAGMSRLVARSVSGGKRHRVCDGAEARAALVYLWGEAPR